MGGVCSTRKRIDPDGRLRSLVRDERPVATAPFPPPQQMSLALCMAAHAAMGVGWQHTQPFVCDGSAHSQLCV